MEVLLRRHAVFMRIKNKVGNLSADYEIKYGLHATQASLALVLHIYINVVFTRLDENTYPFLCKFLDVQLSRISYIVLTIFDKCEMFFYAPAYTSMYKSIKYVHRATVAENWFQMHEVPSNQWRAELFFSIRQQF